MSLAATRLAAVSFLALTAGVAANLTFLQEQRRGGAIETSALGGERGRFAEGQAEVSGKAGSSNATAVSALQVKGQAQTGQLPGQTQIAGIDASVSRAEIVRGVQRELNTRGYGTGQPDGVPGLVTRAAIMAYEFDYGLPLTAEPSQELLSRIVLGTAGPAATFKNAPQLKTAEAESVVKQVKQFLTGAGYAAGKADGKLGYDVIRAIRDFELDQKMPETGRVSGQLVSRLLKLQGQGKSASVR